VHFLIAEAVVREREAELHRHARRERRTPSGTRRRRLGWKLVDLGLRLALTS
jgi:hypothetical protein